MPKFKSTGKLTLGSDGSLIYVPTTHREQYIRDKFNLDEPKRLAFKKSTVIENGKPDVDDNRAEAVMMLEDANIDSSSKWIPKPENLLRFPFRGLSATVVAGGTWRTTDFSDEKVLKRSLKKIIGKSAFTEHWQSTNNCIGVVEAASWSEKRIVGNKVVPAGIDIVYLINAELNQKLVGNLLMNPPAIYSNSVTVEFEWEPSHDDFSDEGGFMRRIGEIHADGRMVARKVTEIIDYHESSILWMGADPFAKLLDAEGNPINPEMGAAFDQVQGLTKEMYDKNKHYFASYSYRKEEINLNIEIENNPMEKLLLELARKILNLEATVEVTQAHIDQISAMKFVASDEHKTLTESLAKAKKVDELEATITELKKNGDAALKKANDDLSKDNLSLKSDVQKLKSEKEAAENKLKELEPFAETGKQRIELMRAETLRLYKVSLGEGKQEDQTMLDTFAKADEKQLSSFLTMFSKGVSEKFEATCKKCGETEVSFRSSFAAPTPEGGVKSKRPHLAEVARN